MLTRDIEYYSFNRYIFLLLLITIIHIQNLLLEIPVTNFGNGGSKITKCTSHLKSCLTDAMQH
jgi:hypothetical protein